MKTIGIVGAGMLGLVLALRLSEKGFKVTLIEGGNEAGGLASPMKIGEFMWDRFYHVILLSDSNLLVLLDQLGLRDKVQWKQTRTGFYVDGYLYSMSDVKEFLGFPPLTLLDRLRLGFTIFYVSRIKSSARLEGIPVAEWLARLSGCRTFEKIWLPLLKSKLGENYKSTSAAFIWAIIARMYAARRSGLKKEMFGYANGGYATILNGLQDLLTEMGVQVICNTPVNQIESTASGVGLQAGKNLRMHFDNTILTIPCSDIPTICPQLVNAEKERLSKVRYQGIICAAMLMKKPLSDYYITNITEDYVPYTAVIEMTALVDKDQFDGRSLIYLPRYVSADDPLWSMGDEQILQEFTKALDSMYPEFKKDDIVWSGIERTPVALPIPTMNYSSEALPPYMTSLEHIFMVNSAQIADGTMNVNEIVGLANRRASEIASYLS